jgi:predicted XRE-type DNA-binding protein
MASPHRRKTSTSSAAASPRRSAITRRGSAETGRKRPTGVLESSGNVFADLGFPNPEREQLKARLTLEIYRIVKERGLTQAQAGTILGIRQPHVSSLMRGRSGVFSVERLMEFLTALGRDVEIIVRPANREAGQLSVVLDR